MSGSCVNRSDALAIIATCVSQAEQAARGHTSSEAAGPVAAATQLPAALVSRQRVAFAQAPSGQAGASLADLSGDVPDDELRAAHVGVLMQQLSQLPVFSNMGSHKPPLFSMYGCHSGRSCHHLRRTGALQLMMSNLPLPSLARWYTYMAACWWCYHSCCLWCCRVVRVRECETH